MTLVVLNSADDGTASISLELQHKHMNHSEHPPSASAAAAPPGRAEVSGAFMMP
eukprot:COSAG01_NODE_1424_length_10352_cov_3.066517_3_plen_54_part_00